MATTSLPAGYEIPLRLRVWLEAAAALRLVMIAIWSATWYPFLTGGRTGWGSAFALMLIVLLGSFYLARFSGRLGASSGRVRLLFAVWLIVVLAFSVRALLHSPLPDVAVRSIFSPDIGIFMHLLIVLLVAWRGISLSQSPMDVGETARSFQVGTGALLVFGLAFGSQLSGQSFVPAYAFLWVSLVALAVARITDLSFMRGGRLPGNFRTWALPITAAAALLVALALLLGFAVSEQLGNLSIFFLALFFLLIVLVSAVVAAPVLLLIYLIMPWLQGKFAEGLELLPIQNPQLLADQIFGEELERITQSATGIDRGYLILLGTILVVVFIAVLISIRRRTYARTLATTGDRPESIQSARVPLLSTEEPYRRLRWGSAGRLLAAARIRRVYAQLIQMSTRLGTPRPPAFTPLEFQPRLEILFPGRQAELQRITQAYLKVRYGELPEDPVEVEQIEQAWEHVRTEGQMALRSMQKEKREAQRSRGGPR